MKEQLKEKETVSYKSLFCEKEYLKVFIASVISRFGDSIDALAFSWMVYELTGSPSWLAIILGVNSIPSIIFQPFAGVLVENVNKKRIMLITDFGRGIMVSLTAILLYLGKLNPWILLIFTFIISTFEAFRLPAGMAIFPKILPKEKYTYGTAFNSSIGRIAEIVGLASAGIIVGFIGTSGAIGIDALTFFASAFILSFLKISEKVKEKVHFSLASYKKDMKEGFKYFYSKKVIFTICIMGSLLSVFLAPFNTMETAYIGESLKLGPTALSLCGISMTVGLSLGAYLFPIMNKKFSKRTLFLSGGTLAGFSYIILSSLVSINSQVLILIFLALAMFILGMGASLLNVAVSVSFMIHVEEEYLARVGSMFNSMAMATTPISSFLIAIIVKYFSVIQLFIASGILVLVFFLCLSFNNTIKEL